MAEEVSRRIVLKSIVVWGAAALGANILNRKLKGLPFNNIASAEGDDDPFGLERQIGPERWVNLANFFGHSSL